MKKDTQVQFKAADQHLLTAQLLFRSNWKGNSHVVRKRWCLPAGGAIRPTPAALPHSPEPEPGGPSTPCSGPDCQTDPDSVVLADEPAPWAPWSSNFWGFRRWSEPRTAALSSSMPSPHPGGRPCPGLWPPHPTKTANEAVKIVLHQLERKQHSYFHAHLNQHKTKCTSNMRFASETDEAVWDTGLVPPAKSEEEVT